VAAFVGGLAPHSIVLYDTVLAQLKEDEQDAIIGHELGHIANRSIWVYTAVYPLTAVGVVLLSFLFGGYLETIAGMALYVVTFRILSRRFEYDCDRHSRRVPMRWHEGCGGFMYDIRLANPDY
jgi:Zn-dependent protease with chaperone function